LTSENDVFGGHLTLLKYKIVECGAFCEVIFFYISPKNLPGDFFYSPNGQGERCPPQAYYGASRLSGVRSTLGLGGAILPLVTFFQLP
jgi:hypothetical protein